MGELLTPYQAANQIEGMTVGNLYYGVRSGKIETKGKNDKGTPLIDLDDAIAFAERPRAIRSGIGSKGGPGARTRAATSRAGVRKGSVTSWQRKGARWNGPTDRGQTIAQVTDVDSETGMVLMRTDDDRTVEFTTESLTERIAKGVVHIEHPEELLEMVIRQYREDGFAAGAQRLEAALSWIFDNKPKGKQAMSVQSEPQPVATS